MIYTYTHTHIYIYIYIHPTSPILHQNHTPATNHILHIPSPPTSHTTIACHITPYHSGNSQYLPLTHTESNPRPTLFFNPITQIIETDQPPHHNLQKKSPQTHFWSDLNRPLLPKVWPNLPPNPHSSALSPHSLCEHTWPEVTWHISNWKENHAIITWKGLPPLHEGEVHNPKILQERPCQYY